MRIRAVGSQEEEGRYARQDDDAVASFREMGGQRRRGACLCAGLRVRQDSPNRHGGAASVRGREGWGQMRRLPARQLAQGAARCLGRRNGAVVRAAVRCRLSTAFRGMLVEGPRSPFLSAAGQAEDNLDLEDKLLEIQRRNKRMARMAIRTQDQGPARTRSF